MKERDGLVRLDTKYLVFEREDIAKYYTPEQIETFSDIATRIDIMRAKEGKSQLYGVLFATLGLNLSQ